MKQMKVILRADVDGLGHRGDIVEVSKGYVRNFLEPRSLAMPATPGAVTQAASMRKARDERDAARTVAPLRPAEDALTIDTTGIPVDSVVAAVLSVVRPA